MIHELHIDTKLRMYIELNDTERVIKCLKNGANPNIYDPHDGCTLLAFCINQRNFELFDILLDNGADPTLKINETNIFYYLYDYIKNSNDARKLELVMWIHKKELQEKLININTKMYFILKQYDFLLPELIEKYSFLEATNELNLL